MPYLYHLAGYKGIKRVFKRGRELAVVTQMNSDFVVNALIKSPLLHHLLLFSR